MHFCRRHKGLHILGDWWPWPSATCCCMSVLEDGGSLLGTLLPRDSKAMTMKVGIRFGVCNNPLADLLHCECTQHPVIP